MAMLALLDRGPRHGFSLKSGYDSLLGQERELKPGQVYATLSRLERDDLARGAGIVRGDGPDRKVYAITAAGVEELRSWLSRPAEASGRPSEVFTKVVLALVAGQDAGSVLERQRAAYLRRARELVAARHDGDAIDRIARDYEMAHLEADLRWIEVAAARLGDLGSFVDEVVPHRPEEAS